MWQDLHLFTKEIWQQQEPVNRRAPVGSGRAVQKPGCSLARGLSCVLRRAEAKATCCWRFTSSIWWGWWLPVGDEEVAATRESCVHHYSKGSRFSSATLAIKHNNNWQVLVSSSLSALNSLFHFLLRLFSVGIAEGLPGFWESLSHTCSWWSLSIHVRLLNCGSRM